MCEQPLTEPEIVGLTTVRLVDSQPVFRCGACGAFTTVGAYGVAATRTVRRWHLESCRYAEVHQALGS